MRVLCLRTAIKLSYESLRCDATHYRYAPCNVQTLLQLTVSSSSLDFDIKIATVLGTMNYISVYNL